MHPPEYLPIIPSCDRGCAFTCVHVPADIRRVEHTMSFNYNPRGLINIRDDDRHVLALASSNYSTCCLRRSRWSWPGQLTTDWQPTAGAEAGRSLDCLYLLKCHRLVPVQCEGRLIYRIISTNTTIRSRRSQYHQCCESCLTNRPQIITDKRLSATRSTVAITVKYTVSSLTSISFQIALRHAPAHSNK